jgi:hypothetical protein
VSVYKERIATQCVCCGSGDLENSPAILMPFVAARAFGWYPQRIDESWGLKTIENGMAYSICNSLNCQSCGHLFLDIRFSDHEMSNLYQNYRGAEYVQLREKYEPGYSVRNDALNNGVSFIDEVEAFLTPYISGVLTVLDWGGDTGVNTPFKSLAKSIDIYDISNKEVIAGINSISLDEALKKKYQLVICSQVLEHTPYPAKVISKIAQVMGPSSILYIELPCESLVRESSDHKNLASKKKHWHEHVNFYSESSIRALLLFCGLELIDLEVKKVDISFNQNAYIFQVVAKLL